MKTIKELAQNKKTYLNHDVNCITCHLNQGYLNALKDILKLIDELDFEDGFIMLNKLEARIKG